MFAKVIWCQCKVLLKKSKYCKLDSDFFIGFYAESEKQKKNTEYVVLGRLD